MTWKSYAIVSGAGVVATYLMSGPVTVVPEPSRPAVSSAAPQSAPAADIEQEAARLQARLRAEAVFREPARDPFRFSAARRSQPTAPVAAPVDPRPMPPPPPREEPFISLAGVATDVIDGVPKRTAILTTTAGLVFAREGESVGTDYVVRSVGEDSVELSSTADGSTRLIRMLAPQP